MGTHITSPTIGAGTTSVAVHTAGRSATEGRTMTEEEFRAFYLGSYARVVRAASPLLRDAVEAEDVTQEAFARAYVRRRQLASYEDPEAWVRTVAINLACSRWRRVRVATRHLLTVRAPQTAPDPGISSDRHLDLMAALRRLPQRQRELLVLHYFADHSVAVLAESHGMTDGAVRTQLSRGRARLAQLLEQS